ncbi:phosphatase PAP2 family protein [Alicyclobacillus acidocaldarius]|uniref:Phosphoesterase PA-phosphatase related protein n=1 Tax=Alicyclobacillus acidocaldarius (strain Tc-4-1) TaxID=1048834 RepID=F8IG08_ALIAT|nr:phosphatase PAP2 family protein [Alicyclobacillus acidocaldarius]AEJ42979.1 phosphoesterase PA-phosphatase related protein [Alicyclobacillus acidocaldarius subsp. acidocaldarius Tc-4-1]
MGRVLKIWSLIERADWRVLRWCERLWGRSPAFDAAMMASALYTPFVMLAIIAIAASGWLGQARSAAAFWAAAASVAAAVMVRVAHEPISRAARRPRPFEVEPMRVLVEHEPGESFPSNHAAGGFALAVGGWHLGAVAYVMLALAIWLAVARIYCGLHYPSDVIAGAASGAAAGYVCSFLQWTYREPLMHALPGMDPGGR